MPTSALPSSSPASIDCQPSSLRPLGVAGHERIVSAKPGPRKCGTRNQSPVQWQDVQDELEQMLFCDRVKWIREALCLSHSEAALAWGYSRTQIIAWEKGRAETTWSRWNEIESSALEKLFSMMRTGT